MTGRLLTTREVAEMLGLSPESVLRRWRRGELPGYRLSSNVLRFDFREVMATIEHRGPRAPCSPAAERLVDRQRVVGEARQPLDTTTCQEVKGNVAELGDHQRPGGGTVT